MNVLNGFMTARDFMTVWFCSELLYTSRLNVSSLVVLLVSNIAILYLLLTIS